MNKVRLLRQYPSLYIGYNLANNAIHYLLGLDSVSFCGQSVGKVREWEEVEP